MIDISCYNKKKETIEVSSKEKNLIELLRETGYGQVVIFIEGSQPVRVERIKESVKL